MNLKRLAALMLAALLVFTTLCACGQRVEKPVEYPNTIDAAVTDVPPATDPADSVTDPVMTSDTEPSTEPITEATTEPTTEATTEPTTITTEKTEETTKKTSKNDYTVESMSGTMYATLSLNVRKGPSTDFAKIGTLNEGQAVTVTGRASTGWYEIDFNGQKGYVSNAYVTTEEPAKKPVEVTTKPVSNNQGDDDEDAESVDDNRTSNTPSGGDTTTPSNPSSGTVIAGDWVKDNYAETMFERFTEDKYKNAFNKLAMAVQSLAPSVNLGDYLTHDECVEVGNNIAQVVGTGYCYFDCATSVKGTTLYLQYYVNSYEEASKMVSALEKQGKKVVNACSSYSEYNKVKYIYEWIVRNSKYDSSAKYYASAYGPIVDGGGTCMGYAKSTFYLLSMAGFDCVYGVGKGIKEPHIWVKVKIDGKWYNVDTGWGDPETPTAKDPSYVCYDFLCVTDDYMKNTRTSVYDLSKYYSSPAANSDDLNWYKLNNCYATSFSEATAILKSAAKEAIKDTSSDYVYVRIQMSDMTVYQQVFDYYSRQVYQDEILASITSKRATNSRFADDGVKKTRTLVYRLRQN